jgi:hypothetical protein
MPRKRKIDGEREVDLAALVDILGNMLFFLLATVSFLQLKTLNASVPALSSGAVSTGKAVDVTVEVKQTGYVLKANGEAADPSTKFHPVQIEIPRITDGAACTAVKAQAPCLDRKRLTKELWEIKKQTPETKNIMIFPEQGTQFADIVFTMDASREMPSIIDPNKKVSLFSRPVLSELVEGTEQERDDNK